MDNTENLRFIMDETSAPYEPGDPLYPQNYPQDDIDKAFIEYITREYGLVFKNKEFS